MAIERHDGYGPAVDSGTARTEGGDRPARPLGERSTGDRPVPEERRSRSELHAALRATDTGTDCAPRPVHRDAPRTTPDGAWEWKGLRLEPGANRIADRELSARRSAEGRDADGKYGDRGITPAMRRVEAKLDHGTLVPDTEKFALKTPARFKEKLAKMINRYPDRTPDQLASSIHDGIRYTFVFDTSGYTEGVRQALSELAKEGHELRLLRPSWDDPDYKGVNSRWCDKGSGFLFEVQFHTHESWSAKQATHDVYEKLADPRTTPEQRPQLEQEQRKITAGVTVPGGAVDIACYSAKEQHA